MLFTKRNIQNSFPEWMKLFRSGLFSIDFPSCQCRGQWETWVQPLGLGRSPGGGNGNPHQYSCLENPMDRGLWRAKVRRVAKSRIWLKRLSMHSCKVSIITGSIVSHRVKAIKGPLHWKALPTRLTTQEPFLSWVDQCFSQKCHLLRFNEWINEQMNEYILKSSSET